MFVNPDKFHAILLNKQKSDYNVNKLTVDSEKNQVIFSVDLLGVTIHNKLNFNLHVCSICKCASNQLNALISSKNIL